MQAMATSVLYGGPEVVLTASTSASSSMGPWDKPEVSLTLRGMLRWLDRRLFERSESRLCSLPRRADGGDMFLAGVVLRASWTAV